jgi:hypothetical protein
MIVETLERQMTLVPVANDPVIDALLKQLEDEEQALMTARLELRKVQANWEVVSSKYAVVRDIVTRRLGYSPYSPRSPLHDLRLPSKGSFRFLNMSYGDAAVAVLNESEEPLALADIVAKLRTGGVYGTSEVLTRTVNAALMRKAGIGKTDENKYFLPEEDKLPF